MKDGQFAVWWYRRYRVAYADVAQGLAERGVHVDRSTLDDPVEVAAWPLLAFTDFGRTQAN